MLSLQRVSFRQMLVVAFLLVAGLMATASLRGLFTLERLLMQSRQAAQRAMQVNAGMQELALRSVTMERAARQYLVLDDTVLRERFDASAREALAVLQRLSDDGLAPQPAQSWRAQLAIVKAQLQGPRDTAFEREQVLALAFRELNDINTGLAEQLRRTTEQRNQALAAELEARRLELARLVLGAIGLAVVLALGFGVWLARPLQRVERAIDRLGANRLDEVIEIRGPSDVRRLGQRLDWLRQRLAEADEDKARFLRHVSHELKTPLAALREGVSLLEEGVAGALSDSQREVARILRQNTATLQRQIEDLLSYNAAAFNARQLNRSRTELGALVDGLVEAQQLQWQARQLNIEVSGGPLWIEVDADKLATALGNLLSNAIRFSPVGGGIRIVLTPFPTHAQIDIRDTGPGVAPDDRSRVFDPFYRGERQPQDALRGSGIGLSIVREYILGHGGRIELLPDEPGAHFRIELPHAHA